MLLSHWCTFHYPNERSCIQCTTFVTVQLRFAAVLHVFLSVRALVEVKYATRIYILVSIELQFTASVNIASVNIQPHLFFISLFHLAQFAGNWQLVNIIHTGIFFYGVHSGENPDGRSHPQACVEYVPVFLHKICGLNS